MDSTTLSDPDPRPTMKTKWHGCPLPLQSDDPTVDTCPNAHTLCLGVLQAETTSWAARGFLVWLMTRPEGVTMEEIVDHSHSPHELTAILKELVMADLLELEPAERLEVALVTAMTEGR